MLQLFLYRVWKQVPYPGFHNLKGGRKVKGMMIKSATAIAAGAMLMTAGTAFGQIGGKVPGADTQVIEQTVMNLVNSKINENFNNKVAMPEMRNKFMSDPSVVGAMEQQIIPEMQKQMMQKIKSQIQNDQMNKMSNMTTSNMKI